jgi:hypothetical protein
LVGSGCSYLLPSLQTPPLCPPGTVLCNNLTCSDLRNDPYNCGFCDNACGQGLSCKFVDGGSVYFDGGIAYFDGGAACQCTIPDAVFWNGACFDLTNDPNNCGAIGLSCGATQACIDGGCGCAGLGSGDGGIHACPGDAGPVCTDLRGDPHHCGSCSNDCGVYADCMGGVCAPLDAGIVNDGGMDAGPPDGGDAGIPDAGPDGGGAGDGGDGGP